MRHTLADGTLTLYPEGRIDTANVKGTEDAAFSIIRETLHDRLVMDLEALTYISSAGLRSILKLRKADSTLSLINASAEVYDTLEITGFTEILPVAKTFRRLSVEGCPVLGSGSNGVVYRYDPELVVKVYRNPDALEDIRRERELARKALIMGVPTAIPFDVVKVGESYASVFELLNADSFSRLIAAHAGEAERYIALFTDLLLSIHHTEADPGELPDIRQTVLRWARDLQGELPEDIFAKLQRLIEEVPERHTLIHGDYHTNNVVLQNGETLLIDMDTLSQGHPVFELGSMYLAFVGFYETAASNFSGYLNMPCAAARSIWQQFLPRYLGTEDAGRIAAAEDSARIIGYTRLLRRTLRRGGGTPESLRTIRHCREQLIRLVERTESLDL